MTGGHARSSQVVVRLLPLLVILLAACGDLTLPDRVAEQRPVEVSPLQPPAAGEVPPGGSGWATVSVGRDRTCALDVEGAAWCWGAEGAAPTGTGGATATCRSGPCVPSPARVRGGLRFRAVAVGAGHACAVALDGGAWCWGDNEQGQLGVGSPRVAGEPVSVPAQGPFVAIAAGSDHSCAIRVDGTAVCWGGNAMGQLGRGTREASDRPAAVQGSARFRSISAGFERSCALTAEGVAWCWGAVWQYSEGGLEYSRHQAVPEQVASAPRFAQLSVGVLTTCGAGADGAGWCWEANGFGQMGTESLEGSAVPQRVAGGTAFAQVSAGGIQSCGIDLARRGWCWGNNSFGQLGVPEVRARCASADLPCTRTPVPLGEQLRFTTLVTGLGSHVCGVTTLTNLYCWGLGTGGQLGLGDPGIQLRQVPTFVARR